MQSQDHGTCNKILKILGDYWTLLIIKSLGESEMRFCELQRAAGDVNPVTLTSRLKKLEECSFLERKEESLDKQSVTYHLTEKGRGVLPIIASIDTFSENFQTST